MLAKILKSGKLHNDIEGQLFFIRSYRNYEEKISIPYSTLKDFEWGYVYEKYVGQYFEERGFDVEYRGLSKGFLDGGIDLIAKNEDQTYFIQCKYIKKSKITKTQIEQILYKGGNTISRMHHSTRDIFALVIPDKDLAFRKIEKKSNSLIKRFEYPIYDYFLSKNHIQNQIKLDIIELDMV